MISVIFRARTEFTVYIRSGEFSSIGESMVVFGGDGGNPLGLLADIGILSSIGVIWAVLWPVALIAGVISLLAVLGRKIHVRNEEKKEIMNRLRGESS